MAFDKSKKLIIFDFDGVLADSFEPLYRLNALASEAIGKKMSHRQYKNFFTGNLAEKFRKFCANHENYEKFCDFKKNIYWEHYSGVKLFPYAASLVLGLKDRNIILAIISATSPNFIKKILAKFKLEDKFDFILGSGGESKIEIIREIARKSKAGDNYFISDTHNDIKYGRQAGVKTIGVCWGFHDKSLLMRAKPDFILDNHKDIFKII